MEQQQPSVIPEFKIYNRYHELERRERERKELAWEKELEIAMNSSVSIERGKKEDGQIPTCQSCPKLDECAASPKLKKMMSYDASYRKGKMRSLDKYCKSISEHSQLTDETVKRMTTATGTDDGKLQSIDFIDRTPSPVEKRGEAT